MNGLVKFGQRVREPKPDTVRWLAPHNDGSEINDDAPIGQQQSTPAIYGASKMYRLPETGFLRLPQIIGNPQAEPPIQPIIPVKKSAWWAGCKAGRYPAPVKLSPRVTAWRVEDIRTLVAKLGGAA